MFISKLKTRLGFTLVGLGTYLIALTADSINQWIALGIAVLLIFIGVILIHEF